MPLSSFPCAYSQYIALCNSIAMWNLFQAGVQLATICLSRLLPVIAALLVLVMFRTVFILGYVPTNSMKPTLEAGSLILGVRIKGSFEVGDVVIFCHGGNLFVKRIAAVGGNVVMHNGINMSVPESSYYMLGDNADDSYDSRYWDEPFVPVTTVVAKVWLPIGSR